MKNCDLFKYDENYLRGKAGTVTGSTFTWLILRKYIKDIKIKIFLFFVFYIDFMIKLTLKFSVENTYGKLYDLED